MWRDVLKLPACPIEHEILWPQEGLGKSSNYWEGRASEQNEKVNGTCTMERREPNHDRIGI